MAAFHSRMSPEDREKYPLLEELAANGVSEYLATGGEFGESQTDLSDPEVPNEGFMISWAADGPDGFSEAQRALLRQTVPYLGLALKSAANRRMATDLLRVYLGRDAGRRVLSGEIQRGSSREIDAVICYFDLKNFTNLAEQIPGPELIDMLNDYFGVAVAVFQSHGGNILKFMGDGILSMFDLGSIGEDARAGLDAVLALKRQLEQRNVERAAEGLPIADFTLALHAGEILYGNIGAENRLDFTVIGPTVNLTSRISGMHRSVGQSIILSEAVRRAAQPTPHDLVSLGRYMLRGVSEPIELFTIYEGGRR
jgi:adenylate cyclase